jgi:lipid A disaccharide synthetase
VRYFFSTGEASGELNAVLLARAIAAYDPQAQFEGIGAERMRSDGFTLWRNHTGWASMGPLAAIPRIPPLLVTMWRTASGGGKARADRAGRFRRVQHALG